MGFSASVGADVQPHSTANSPYHCKTNRDGTLLLQLDNLVHVGFVDTGDTNVKRIYLAAYGGDKTAYGVVLGDTVD